MAKSIMIQGTMSNVGKSLISAALCRIFRQDGYRAAPFKSQNMALNSFVTADGFEIGRAQAMQAECAGVAPSALMNPILLKPTSDVASQVILNGVPVGDMTAREYYSRKKDFIPEVENAFKKLSESFDIIVIEGAGSPVELNLGAEGFVNMGMAKIARAPVLLVGDIDRGGVFAQLLGTLMLFEERERELVKALVVNKFRGDKSIFSSGISILEQRGKIPVAGVIPFIKCDIDDEDSLSDRLENRTAKGIIDIAAIRLPRISNFTDLDVFSSYEGVSVRYVSKPEELLSPDLVVIPGTKSTISDMKFLRESGLECAVKKCAANGVPIFGICGGYQMLCEEISDPLCSEGGGSIRGMGLLRGKTVFSAEKTRTISEGKFEHISGIFSELSGLNFRGYEIHMGRTSTPELPLLDVGGAHNGNVYGCYVHGIFDNSEVSDAIVNALYKRRGIDRKIKNVDRAEYKNSQYDILAKNVRENLDMKLIYEILERGV